MHCFVLGRGSVSPAHHRPETSDPADSDRIDGISSDGRIRVATSPSKNGHARQLLASVPDRGASAGGGGVLAAGGLPGRCGAVRGSWASGEGGSNRVVGPIMTISGPTVLQARPIIQSRGASRAGFLPMQAVPNTNASDSAFKETLGEWHS